MTQKTIPIVLVILCLGCAKGGEGDRAAVNGKISLDGVPVSAGAITFVPIGGTKGSTVGGQFEGGRYTISAAEGPLPGRYRVEIRAPERTGKKVRHPLDPKDTVDEVLDTIPNKYNSASTLERDVKAGKNVLDFELSKKWATATASSHRVDAVLPFPCVARPLQAVLSVEFSTASILAPFLLDN